MEIMKGIAGSHQTNLSIKEHNSYFYLFQVPTHDQKMFDKSIHECSNSIFCYIKLIKLNHTLELIVI